MNYFTQKLGSVILGNPRTGNTNQVIQVPAVPDELHVGYGLGGGRIIIGKVLGRGGFGITYRAIERPSRREIAVKELFIDGVNIRNGYDVCCVSPSGNTEFQNAKREFVKEARALADLSSPSIVRLFNYFEENNTAYMSMEYLEGRTLQELIEKSGRLPEDKAIQVVVSVGSALETLHDTGLIHQDTHPSNIVECFDDRFVLLDFGLVKKFRAQSPLGTQVLGSGKNFGRPGYAPIEQYQRHGATDPRSDVFSLAATLYFMLTGDEPIPAPDRIYRDSMIPPHLKKSAISPDISKAVMWGLQIEASKRPTTIKVFLDALEIALQRKEEEKKQRRLQLSTPKVSKPPAPSAFISQSGARNDARNKIITYYAKLLNRNPHKHGVIGKLRDQQLMQMEEQISYWTGKGLTFIDALQKYTESACEAGNKEEQL